MLKINTTPTDALFNGQIDLSIANIPKSLYFLGNTPTGSKPRVAIVGTRRPTPYGQEIGYQIGYELAKQGVIIISGLALGTDSIVHKAALDAKGTTWAVMAGGLDTIHPRSNISLARRLLQTGGTLISEYPPGSPPFAANFIARNRIVAALADCVVVVEAAAKSGTMHTASFALSYGRSVMAVPGAITNPMSQGTNNLISMGARLVRGANDILDEIGLTPAYQQTALPLGSTPEETTVINLLANGLRQGDELQKKSKLAPALFNQTLTMLEINGVVRPLGGNQWALTGQKI